MTAVDGWAVLTGDALDELSPYTSDGNQCQLPIFPTRKQAVSWRDGRYDPTGRIVRVVITMFPFRPDMRIGRSKKKKDRV